MEMVRLSWQSLRNLDYWRSLARGGGRELRGTRDMVMHSDAGDVDYGWTLGFKEEEGFPGL